MEVQCWSCRKTIEVGDRIGRTEECPLCYADLHCCEMCQFYDTSTSQDCRESQADYVLKKNKSNFCDYFAVQTQFGQVNKVDDAKARLEALFKK